MQNLLFYGAASAAIAVATLTHSGAASLSYDSSVIWNNGLQQTLAVEAKTAYNAATTNNTLSLWELTTRATTAATAIAGIGSGSSLTRSRLVDEGGGYDGGNRDESNGSDGVAAYGDNLMQALSTTASFIYNNNNNNNSSSNSKSSISGNLTAVTETPYVPYVMRPETYIVPVLFALIFIVGVLGNGTLIVVFLSVRQMRNVPNT